MLALTGSETASCGRVPAVQVGFACSTAAAVDQRSVQLLLPDATTHACSGSTNQVKWCADSANGLQPFGLYRQVGTSCSASTGALRAGSLNTNLVFSNPTCTAGTRPRLSVALPVNANIGPSTQVYRLSDTITDRNASVC